ncbi:MAG: tyrosine-type recombinase/integrase [Oscillospiraceae bacterium]|nr:tyrosine-type recombinase/integrase [Oscillospiraceae bacterium]
MVDSAHIDSFRDYLVDIRRVSPNTVASYIRDVNQLFGFLNDSGKSTISDITEVDVRMFIQNLENNGRSVATISRCITSLKVFFTRLTQEGLFKENPILGISTKSREKKPPQLHSDIEIERFLSLPDGTGAKSLRDKAILETLYATGLRVSELISLDVSDVNLETGLLICRNGNERNIPIYAQAIKAINLYLKASRKILAHPGENALFVNANGKRLSRQGLWKILDSYKKEAQIDDDITPQTLRNSFAAHLLENGADLQSLQKLLGHADISSTRVIARAVKNQIKDVYNKSHPKA